MRNKSNSILCLHQGVELYGSDRSFLTTVETLADAGMKLDVILPDSGELATKVKKIDGVTLSFYGKGVLRKRELKQPLSFLLNILVGFFFFLRRFGRYQVIYINTVVMFSALLAACFYRFSSKRLICHVREIPGGFQLRFFRVLLSLSGVELVFNSRATQTAFGLPGKVIYNGVDYVKQAETDVSVKSRHSSDFLNLLLIGRVNEWKGQFFLVKVLSNLSADVRSRLRVRIVGSPFEGYEYLIDDLKVKVEKAGLVGVVELIPFCHEPSIHYSWSDYVLVPSVQPEPFGRVAIEAFSYAKPVIAAGHGGLVEIVENGASGFLFEPANEAELVVRLTELLNMSATHYTELCHGAYERFEKHFSIKSYRENLRSLFIF